MKRYIRNWIAAIIFVTTAGGATLALATPQTASAACADRLLTFPAWYKGVVDADCNVQSPASFPGGLTAFIWHIALNILEAILQVVGYVTVGFIIAGGFKYMTSTGSPDGMAKARTTILNAVVGLVISIFSIAIVNVVAGAL